MDEFPLPLRLFNGEGKEIYINHAYGKLIGLSEAEVKKDAQPPVVLEQSFYKDFLINKTRSSRFVRTEELPGYKAQRGPKSFVQETIFPHFTKGQTFTGFMSVLQFIQSQHQSSIQDQLSNGLFRQAFEQSTLPIVISVADHQLLYANPAAMGLLGYGFEELEKILPRGIFAPGEFEKHNPQIKEALGNGEPFSKLRVRLMKKNGEEFYASITLNFVHSEDQQPIFRITQIEDVDDEVRRAQQLTQALQRQKDESAIKDKLLRVVGHDIKNNINGIQGMLHLIGDEQTQHLDKQTAMGYALDSVLKLEDLVDNLLLWSKSGREDFVLNMENLYLNEKISEVVDYISARVKMKEQEVQVDIQEDFWAVTDSYVLSAILKNALSNAIKYSPKGSTINLRAFKDGGKIQIQIQDHGVGFADRAALPAFLQGEGLLPRKPGTTGEKGNGIGLVIIRDFLRKMGQKLQIETGEEGTTLSFHLEQFSMG